MRFLLDVNALVALAVLQHEFHERVGAWLRSLLAKGSVELATCSITELGFLRILTQAAQYELSVVQAKELLARLKSANVVRFSFISDDHDLSKLPEWVKTAKQTTDGHLLELARANGAVLATLDAHIPGAALIPSQSRAR